MLLAPHFARARSWPHRVENLQTTDHGGERRRTRRRTWTCRARRSSSSESVLAVSTLHPPTIVPSNAAPAAQPVVGPAPPASRLQRRALVRGRGAGESVTAPRHLPPSPHQRNSSAHKWAKMAKFATAHVDVDRHARRHQQLTHLETIAPRGVSQSVRTAKPPHARRRPAWRLASRRPHPTRRPSAVTSPPSPSVPFFYLLAGPPDSKGQ